MGHRDFMSIDLNRYQDFVARITSNASNELTTFTDTCDRLDSMRHGPKINVPLLLTGALGLAAECGEFCEIPKKIFFQGKPLDEESVLHMKRELGDIIWYWINACRALNLDPNDVIAENVRKLQSRYPGGSFDLHHSENRRPGDL